MNSNLQQAKFSEIQHYSDRIKNVLLKINKKNNLNVDIVDYAKEITKEIYVGIQRKYGGSYYEKHLVGVQKMVGNIIIDNDDFRKFTEIVAILHDVVEDRLMSYEELENIFSQEIRHIVWTLSESKESRKFKEAHIGKVLTFVEGKNSNEREYTKKDMKVDMLRESLLKIKLLKNLPNQLYYQSAAIVRVADMIHNLSDFRLQKKDLLDRNIVKAEIIFEELNDTLLSKELKDVVDELKWLLKKN